MSQPDHINPFQWNEAIGIARQVCARIFRDGGQPGDALKAFHLAAAGPANLDWARAVETIAFDLCRQRGTQRRAA
jgi:hypothetical protein